MRYTGLCLCCLALMWTAMACVAQDNQSNEFDEELAEQYRNALPSASLLQARSPLQTDSSSQGLREQALIGDSALYPSLAVPLAVSINDSVTSMLDLLEQVTQLPPTDFDKEENTFVWGPYNHDDGFGQVAVIIADNGEDTDEDFRYFYIFGRIAPDKPDSFTPVILGGTNRDKDNDEYGEGITLWDYEANRQFLETYGDGAEEGGPIQGRFVTIYGRGPAEDDPDATTSLVLASFRDFAEEDDDEPADLDYLYGNVVFEDVQVDFLNFKLRTNINEGDELENLDVRLGFINRGHGRAQAIATGGDIGKEDPEIEAARVVECWDEDINQTFIRFSGADGGGEPVFEQEDGNVEDCGIFKATLEELELPTLNDVDQSLLDGLDQIATMGL